MPGKHWKGIIAGLHESIKAKEEVSEYDYVGDEYKTPAMRRWEKRFNQRIDIALRTEPLICARYPRLCTKVNSARCFYHRYGQIDARLSLAWRRMMALEYMNPKVIKVFEYMENKRKEMERIKVKRVPLVLTEKEVLVIIQALALVPKDLEIE